MTPSIVMKGSSDLILLLFVDDIAHVDFDDEFAEFPGQVHRNIGQL